MARAGKVTGIRPKASLQENAVRVVEKRLSELLSWEPALDDPQLVQELHDMRIAAKRLRYALEMFDVCFPEVKSVLKELTQLQEELGSIHDLDVLRAVFQDRIRRLDAAVEEDALTIMRGEGSPRDKHRALQRLLAAQARDRRRVGFIGLLADKRYQREREYQKIQARWGNGGLARLATDIRKLTTFHTVVEPSEDPVMSEVGG